MLYEVITDIKIPLNEETFKASMMDGQDVELKYAIEAMNN